MPYAKIYNTVVLASIWKMSDIFKKSQVQVLLNTMVVAIPGCGFTSQVLYS